MDRYILTKPCKIHPNRPKPDGHVQIHFRGRKVLVHRLEFFKHYNYWPEFVLHKCNTPACYEIEHLYDGTRSDNRQDFLATNPNLRQGDFFRCGHAKTPVNSYRNGYQKGKAYYICALCKLAKERAKRWH